MMAAIVVIPSTSIPDASAARKRRREILASQRQSLDAGNTSSPTSAALVASLTSVAHGQEGQPRKARRVSDFSEKVTNGSITIGESAAKTKVASERKVSAKKKPQMKYDPDVPMTKEEAAIWRREQRRKRNRESAALSRQRQRDRIGDLEIEIGEWKSKVESIMGRIKKLEEASGIDSLLLVPEPLPKQEEHVPKQSVEFEVINDDVKQSKFVSPPPSPGHNTPGSLEEAYPVASSSSAKTVVDAVVDQVLMGIESYEQEFSNNMISRHAVKIADAPALPFLPKSEDSIAVVPSPDACVSKDVTHAVPGKCNAINNNSPSMAVAPTATSLKPIDSSLFPIKQEDKLPTLLTDEENEDEFGEFLLDAVQWL